MTKNKSDKCEICGKSLTYATGIENYKELTCAFCDKKDTVNTCLLYTSPSPRD